MTRRPNRTLAIWTILAALAAALPVVAQSPPPPPVWHSPVLTWAGTTGYLATGVKPGSGLPQSTFTFKIKYTHQDNLPPQYARLQLTGPAGGAYTGSPFTMVSDGTTNRVNGVIFSVSVPLKKVGTYKYNFVASDGGALVTYPTSPVSGPTVNTPPALSWAGLSGYTTDGVAPNSAPMGSTITFKVKYTDADGPAKSVAVQIWGPDGKEIAGSPLSLTYSSSPTPNWAAGVIYSAAKVFSAAGTYQYRFTASDGIALAYLPSATGRMTGPTITTGPLIALNWAGIAGFAVDGIAPNTAVTGATIRFKVKCSTSDGSAVPVTLQVWRPNGKEMVGSPFTLTPDSGTPDWHSGAVLGTSLVLSALGTYQYRFNASNVTLSGSGPVMTTG